MPAMMNIRAMASYLPTTTFSSLSSIPDFAIAGPAVFSSFPVLLGLDKNLPYFCWDTQLSGYGVDAAGENGPNVRRKTPSVHLQLAVRTGCLPVLPVGQRQVLYFIRL